MAKKGRNRGSGRLKKALGAVLVVALVAAGVSWQTGWGTDWVEEQWQQWRGTPAETGDPAAVAPPAELDLPAVVVPPPVALPADGAAVLDPAAVKSALAALGDPDLGRHVLAAVGPLAGSGLTHSSGRGAPVAMPASTTKVVTAAVALSLLGPEHRFETTTVLDAAGATPRLILVGGGDPYLARRPTADQTAGQTPGATGTATFEPVRADVRTLARRTATALLAEGVTAVRLGYDDTLFSGPAVNPTWEPDYVPEEIGPVTALSVDQGRMADQWAYVTDPAAVAAAELAKALTRAGVEVVGPIEASPAPAGATPLGAVAGPTLAQIVQRLIEVSDNVASEVLLRHIGLAHSGVGSAEAGQVGVKRVLRSHGIALGKSVLYDGSGLSRANRLAPSVLVEVLRLAASDAQPQLRPLLASLPVAGFTGSLAERMDTGPAAGRGRVRAKTGTLTGVSALAGIAVDTEGNLMAFALIADRIRKPREGLARVAMDNAAAGLGACACGG